MGCFIRLLPQPPRHAPKKRKKNPQSAVANACGRWYITGERLIYNGIEI